MQDSPNDRASALTYRILREEGEATGFPVLEAILLSPNLRPRDVERGTAKLMQRGHPGSTFRGAVGLAIVAANTKRHGVLMRVEMEPDLATAPSFIQTAVARKKPDLMIIALGGTIVIEGETLSHHVILRQCLSTVTGGQITDFDFGPISVLALGEVTISREKEHLVDRANRVAIWSRGFRAVPVSRGLIIASMFVTRSVMFNPKEPSIPPALRLIIMAGEAFLVVVGGLAHTTKRVAARIAARLQSGQ